ncbi:MAG TPA: hypothetical protein PLN13_07690 [Bacteroidia bacterium]|nr:hypothetical protein [Bacteroidia bacterium]HRH08449.1 hypothetical protein [Bacteroidia bacterium]
MSIDESLKNELEAIQKKMDQLILTYQELKKTSDLSAPKESLKSGFLLDIRKNTEKILKYICKQEGITVTSKTQNGKIDENRPLMLNDYIFHLKANKKIDSNIDHHLDNIKKWCNRTAHDIDADSNEIDIIKSSTIETVFDSYHSLTNWFFKKYAKGAKVDFSKNEYKEKEKPKELTPEELAEERKRFMKDTFNLPDYSILTESKQYKKAKKNQRRKILLRFLFRISILAFVVYFFVKGIMANNSSNEKSPLSKDEVYSMLTSYFNSNNKINTEAHSFFANKVDTFYFMYNLTPAEIDRVQQENTSYIDNKNEIEKESLILSSKNDSISRWQFYTKYTCYRPKLKKFQKNDRILMEFGITNYGKIKFIKQLEKTPEKYSVEKPI